MVLSHTVGGALLGLATLLPWWIGVTIEVISGRGDPGYAFSLSVVFGLIAAVLGLVLGGICGVAAYLVVRVIPVSRVQDAAIAAPTAVVVCLVPVVMIATWLYPDWNVVVCALLLMLVGLGSSVAVRYMNH